MLLQTIEDYRKFLIGFQTFYAKEQREIARHLCRTDLFFLLWWGCGRRDLEHPWLLARCKEVQRQPDNCLDLWARGHYKSTIITFGKTIQDILGSHGEDPLPHFNGNEDTFGIFSCTRPIAKGFLRQIKREFDTNQVLQDLFPDVIWEEPYKEAPKWSEDDGLILKRRSNPKESTVEAWGVVEGQPTSKHFNNLIFDDLVTIEYVRSPLMIEKTIEALALADNLGAHNCKKRIIGTRYHFNDPYNAIISRGEITVRQYPATDNGLPDGEPVLLDKEELAQKRRTQGPYVFSCQMLQCPVADSTKSLPRDKLQWHKGSDGSGMNKYILVDPANETRKESDYTAMFVIGLGTDKNYYILDIMRDRLNLLDRTDALFRLHKKWKPLKVGYERYGMQADIQHIKDRMRRENYNFAIHELHSPVKKTERIARLIPSLYDEKWYLPDSVFHTNYEGRVEDLVDIFINQEYLAFPVPVHDDMLDCMAWVLDDGFAAMWPRIEEEHARRDAYYDAGRPKASSGWAA
jgi:phage terminase large subunit-like protein